MTQTLIVVAVVAVAALFLARRAWRALRPAAGGAAACGDGCGCGTGADDKTRDWASS